MGCIMNIAGSSVFAISALYWKVESVVENNQKICAQAFLRQELSVCRMSKFKVIATSDIKVLPKITHIWHGI